MRGPARSQPRRPLPDDDLAALLKTADAKLLEAIANDTGHPTGLARRHAAEQDHLLVRLAADSGARRGELAGLQFGDLDGRVLHIARAISADIVGTPNSGRDRYVTLGASTARLWDRLEADWQRRIDGEFGPWAFSAQVDHQVRITTGALRHRFARLRDAAGVPGASLHRLRHNVATFLVARGEILQAQARLGHADAATTLREYAYALPLTDTAVADTIDGHLDSIVVEHHTPANHAPS